MACALLVLSTLPSKNIIDGNTLMTRYVMGNRSTVDIEGVEFSPIPDEAKHNHIRTNGTSLARKHSLRNNSYIFKY